MTGTMVAPVLYLEDRLMILDQTQLPERADYIELQTKEDVWDAIYKLRVRGAPAIGVAAAYGSYIAVRGSQETEIEGFYAEFLLVKDYLNSARPTAVNLSWALERMDRRLTAEKARLERGAEAKAAAADMAGGAEADRELAERKSADRVSAGHESAECEHDIGADQAAAAAKLKEAEAVAELKAAMLEEAEAIRREDEAACRAMGEHGLTLLKPKMGILTHCNAGTLATARYGTALSPLYVGHEKGYDFQVFADETRPLLQGARLTAWELTQAGIDVTLICDNMASIVMKNGWIDAVVVGCDRMAANGDGANKIGTSGVAILAKEYGIPFYMFVPTSTIDLATPTGDDITIELRHGDEISEMWYEKPMAPAGVNTYNPAFDVTDANYITAVVTERGIAYPPYSESLRRLVEEK